MSVLHARVRVFVQMKNLLTGNIWLWERGMFINRRYLMQVSIYIVTNVLICFKLNYVTVVTGIEDELIVLTVHFFISSTKRPVIQKLHIIAMAFGLMKLIFAVLCVNERWAFARFRKTAVFLH